MTESLEIRTKKFLKKAKESGFEILSKYKNSETKVLAKCAVCGFENMVRPRNIVSGKGCYKCGMKNFTSSRRFSIDIFKERVKEKTGNSYIVTGKYKNADTKIEMKHVECGNTFDVTPNKFYHCGRRCPHCYQSNPEKEIEGLLLFRDIKFEKQYIIEDCKHVNHLRFDFALDINNTLILIEYNGRQHYEAVDIFGGEKALESTKLRDKIKKNYCQKKNIKLHYISYKQNIEKEINKITNYYANPEPRV